MAELLAEIEVPLPDNYLQPVLDEILVEDDPQDDNPEELYPDVHADEQAVILNVELVDRVLEEQVFAPEFPEGIKLGEGPRRSQLVKMLPRNQDDYVSGQDLDQVLGPSKSMSPKERKKQKNECKV